MARFHVYRLKSDDSLVVDLQADFLDTLHTRIVAPLTKLPDAAKAFARLSPTLKIDDETYMVVIPAMASVPKHLLGRQVADVSHRRDDLVAATDFLFQGF